MSDLIISAVFLAILIAPCVIASFTGHSVRKTI
ncbi:hypothetical protein AciPR4_4071 [Terriglobus saanensis SP1PR4]|uniref:Uncharacterized protein n=1 Tax=Terriglobus saanensis (strain ATCC BAA-1853 / DSM 23119 / SP1PR4) TaxID=401053 RepID=E8V4J5_TERSS|nr:hypothetical protein AciPR4_4071 [Terriglobus saanensis SP1PR4]